VDEIESLLSSIDLSQAHGHRNRAMLETMYACGLRVSEVSTLKISNVYVDLEYISVIGKGNKQRTIPIAPKALQHIQYYKESFRNTLPVVKGHEDILFLNRFGKQISRVSIFEIVKEAAVRASIDKEVSPHTFRHSFATHLVEGGANLRAVQEMMGHESITTTEIYTHLDLNYLRETILQFHPGNKVVH
jgi:integrase/recombinase XerD